MATFVPSQNDIDRRWHVLDADSAVLGRLATAASKLLQGKHKPRYTPFLDLGDHVIIVNAEKVVLTAGKADREMVYRHSGYPGGIKSETYGQLQARKPAEAVRQSVRGMLPKGPLGRQQLSKLKVYAGPDHPHSAQSPKPLALADAKAR